MLENAVVSPLSVIVLTLFFPDNTRPPAPELNYKHLTITFHKACHVASS